MKCTSKKIHQATMTSANKEKSNGIIFWRLSLLNSFKFEWSPDTACRYINDLSDTEFLKKFNVC